MVGLHRRGHHRYGAEEYFAGRAVDADLVTLLDPSTVPARGTRRGVDIERLGAANLVLPIPRATAHARSSAPRSGSRRRRSFPRGRQGLVSADPGPPAPCIYSGAESETDPGGGHPFVSGPRDGESNIRGPAGFPTPATVFVHRDRVSSTNARRSGNGALTTPGCDLPRSMGEFDVGQVPVVRLELAHHFHQPLVRRRVQCLQVVQRQGVADSGNDVLALRLDR